MKNYEKPATAHAPLLGEPFEASLSLWGCVLGGLALCGFSILALRRCVANELEALVGITLAVLDLFLLCLLGVLARQVHLAVWNGKAIWRSRRLELVSHAVGLVVLVFGGWRLEIASVGLVDVLTGALLILGFYATILCLGCWSTLSRSRSQSGLPWVF